MRVSLREVKYSRMWPYDHPALSCFKMNQPEIPVEAYVKMQIKIERSAGTHYLLPSIAFRFAKLLAILSNGFGAASCSTKAYRIPAVSAASNTRFRLTYPVPISTGCWVMPLRSLICHSGNLPGCFLNNSTGSVPDFVAQPKSSSNFTRSALVSASNKS